MPLSESVPFPTQPAGAGDARINAARRRSVSIPYISRSISAPWERFGAGLSNDRDKLSFMRSISSRSVAATYGGCGRFVLGRAIDGISTRWSSGSRTSGCIYGRAVDHEGRDPRHLGSPKIRFAPDSSLEGAVRRRRLGIRLK